MSSATKQIEVQIMGQSYLLGCPEGGQSRLLDAVARVDTAMCKIRDGGKVKARDRIAVLAALNLAFDVSEREAVFTASGFGGLDAAPPAAAAQGSSDTRLASLLQRLDGTMAADGQLL